MANTFKLTDLVAREALLLLRSNLVGTLLFDRRYEGNFTGEEKIGDTVRIRRRYEGAVTEFTSTISPNTITETNVSLQLEKHFDASFELTTKDLTLNLQDLSEQVIAPHVIKIAEAVDTYCLSKLHLVPNVAGSDVWTGANADVPDNLPNSIQALANVRKTLNNLKVPLTGRVQIVSPDYEAILLGTTDFMTADKRGDGGSALESAMLGRVMGMDYFMDQNVNTNTFTAGTFTTGALSADAAAGATSIAIDGAVGATDTLVAGDIINIAGYGNVQVAALATATANAFASVTLREPLRSGVSNNAVVTKFGASGETYQRHGVAFHPRAFAFASVPLVIPPEAHGTVISYEGLSIRAIRDYDIDTKKSIMSLDVLVGATLVDPRLAAQVVKDV